MIRDVEKIKEIIAGFKLGDRVLYCDSCFWRSEKPAQMFAMVNECPDCGKHGLSYINIDKEAKKL